MLDLYILRVGVNHALVQLAQAHVCSVYHLNEGDIRRVVQGAQNIIFFTDDSVIRFAQNEGVAKIFAHEAEVMRTLAKLTPEVPRVLDVQPEAHVMRLEMRPGYELLARTLYPADVWDDLAVRVGRFIATMHGAFPVKHENYLNPVWSKETIDKIDLILAKETDTDARARLEAAKECVQTYGRNADTALYEDWVMSHTDMHEKNKLYDWGSDVLTIIDFTSSKYAPRWRDFVQLRKCYPPEFVEKALKTYQEATGIKIDLAKIDVFQDAIDVYYSEGNTVKLEPRKEPLQLDRPPRSPARPAFIPSQFCGPEIKTLTRE